MVLWQAVATKTNIVTSSTEKCTLKKKKNMSEKTDEDLSEHVISACCFIQILYVFPWVEGSILTLWTCSRALPLYYIIVLIYERYRNTSVWLSPDWRKIAASNCFKTVEKKKKGTTFFVHLVASLCVGPKKINCMTQRQNVGFFLRPMRYCFASAKSVAWSPSVVLKVEISIATSYHMQRRIEVLIEICLKMLKVKTLEPCTYTQYTYIHIYIYILHN